MPYRTWYILRLVSPTSNMVPRSPLILESARWSPHNMDSRPNWSANNQCPFKHRCALAAVMSVLRLSPVRGMLTTTAARSRKPSFAASSTARWKRGIPRRKTVNTVSSLKFLSWFCLGTHGASTVFDSVRRASGNPHGKLNLSCKCRADISRLVCVYGHGRASAVLSSNAFLVSRRMAFCAWSVKSCG